MYEALEEFQKFANQKLKTGTLHVKVTFLPMRADQIEAALTKAWETLSPTESWSRPSANSESPSRRRYRQT